MRMPQKQAHVVSSIFFWNKVLDGSVSCSLSLSMPPTKVCEHCSASVHIRKSVCACGHVLGSKKSSSFESSKRVAVGIRRSLESDVETAARKATDSVSKAKKRALEDEDQRKRVW